MERGGFTFRRVPRDAGKTEHRRCNRGEYLSSLGAGTRPRRAVQDFVVEIGHALFLSANVEDAIATDGEEPLRGGGIGLPADVATIRPSSNALSRSPAFSRFEMIHAHIAEGAWLSSFARVELLDGISALKSWP